MDVDYVSVDLSTGRRVPNSLGIEPNWLEQFATPNLAGRKVYLINRQPTLSDKSFRATRITPQELTDFVDQYLKKMGDTVLTPAGILGLRTLCAHPDFCHSVPVQKLLLSAEDSIAYRQSLNYLTQAASVYKEREERAAKRLQQLPTTFKDTGTQTLVANDGTEFAVFKAAFANFRDTQQIREICAKYPPAFVNLVVRYVQGDQSYVYIPWTDLGLLLQFTSELKSVPLQTMVADALTDTVPWDQVLGIVRTAHSVEPRLMDRIFALLRSHLWEMIDRPELLKTIKHSDLQVLLTAGTCNATEQDIWRIIKQWSALTGVALSSLPLTHWIHIEHLPQALIDSELYTGQPNSPLSEKDRRKWSEQVNQIAQHWTRPARQRIAPAGPPDSEHNPLVEQVLDHLRDLPQMEAARVARKISELAAILRNNKQPVPDGVVNRIQALVCRGLWERKTVPADLAFLTELIHSANKKNEERAVKDALTKIQVQALPAQDPAHCRLPLPNIRDNWLRSIEKDGQWKAPFMQLAPAYFHTHRYLCEQLWDSKSPELLMSFADPYAPEDSAHTSKSSVSLGLVPATSESVAQIDACARLLWIEVGLNPHLRQEVMSQLVKDYIRKDGILEHASGQVKEELFHLARRQYFAPTVWAAALACQTDRTFLARMSSQLDWSHFPESLQLYFGSGDTTMGQPLMSLADFDAFLVKTKSVQPEPYLCPYATDLKIEITEQRMSVIRVNLAAPNKSWWKNLAAKPGPLTQPIRIDRDLWVRVVIEDGRLAVQTRGLVNGRTLCESSFVSTQVPIDSYDWVTAAALDRGHNFYTSNFSVRLSTKQ